MVLHELATNATKHGALSRVGGQVALTWRLVETAPGDSGAGGGGDGRRLVLAWDESGGPRLEGPPRRRGFGTRVVEATVGDQLGGRLRRDWRPGGLYVEIDLPAARILAGAAGRRD
jgi:two-component sensor histidine kinase